MNWDITPVSKLCLLAMDCINKTAPLSEIKTSYKMLRTSNIKDGFIDFDNVRYVEKDVFDKWTRRGAPKYGDVIFTREAPVGEVGRFTSRSKNYFLGQRTFIYRADPNKLDWNFLAYVLQSSQIQGWVNGIAYGATVPHLKVRDMEHLMIPNPPLRTQQKIAKILSNYDDLIENNLKRIKLLEESARLTYEEWFLRFRIDGKKLDIDPESGLPFGWLNKSFADVFNINNGYAFESEDYTDHGVPILRTRDYSQTKWIEVNQPIYISEELSQKYTKYYVQEYDLMLIMVGASIGNYGVVLPNDKGLLQNQNQWAIRVNNGFEKYIFYKLLMMEDLIKNLLTRKTGAARDFFRASFLKELDILLPDEDTVILLNKTVESIFEEINNLRHQNQLLKEARDILLPRLMTGMIDTDDIEVAA